MRQTRNEYKIVSTHLEAVYKRRLVLREEGVSDLYKTYGQNQAMGVKNPEKVSRILWTTP